MFSFAESVSVSGIIYESGTAIGVEDVINGYVKVLEHTASEQ